MPATRRPSSLALNPVLHQQVRMAIVSVLAGRGAATFNELRELLDLSDGNLATHMRSLERAGYVEVEKRFVDRRPLTTYALTPAGRAALEAYLAALERVIREAKR